MKILRSLSMAFTMYSRIPVPRVKWEKDNMAYAMCFFPLVGVVIGAVLYFWLWLCGELGIGIALRSAVSVLMPIGISGAIHMDGFCDTADALGSRQTRERKLEILKDPGAGAIALISCCAYLLLYFALWCEADISAQTMLVTALIPVLSRSLSGLSVVTFRNARGGGLLATFSKAAQTLVVRAVMVVWIVALLITLALLGRLAGIGAGLGAVIVFIYYRLMSYRQFGGITGDLAGYFLQLCEMFSLLFVIIFQRI